jgi:hypothetical protein
MNEIIINPDKTLTVIGSLAHKLYYKHKDKLNSLYDITSNSAWLYEVDGTLRAASNKQEVLNYWKDDRIIVYKKELV